MEKKKWIWIVHAIVVVMALGIGGSMTAYGYWVAQMQSDWTISMSREVTVTVTGLELTLPDIEELEDAEIPLDNGESQSSTDEDGRDSEPAGTDDTDINSAPEAPEAAPPPEVEEPQLPPPPDTETADDSAKAGED